MSEISQTDMGGLQGDTGASRGVAMAPIMALKPMERLLQSRGEQLALNTINFPMALPMMLVQQRLRRYRYESCQQAENKRLDV